MISCRIFVFVILSSLQTPIPELKLVSAGDPPKPPAPASGPSSSPAPPPPETNDDYYTLTYNEADVQKTLAQDNADAATIKDQLAQPDPQYEIIAYVLGKRNRTRRIVINNALEKDKHPLIVKTYTPQNPNGTVFKDVCFGLVQGEYDVLTSYIANAFDNKDETQVIVAMVLTKDMEAMIKTFDRNFAKTFEELRKDQRHPFQNMLRVWAAKSREKDVPGPVKAEDVQKDAQTLLKEQGKWNDKWGCKRDQLELILMVKSIKYARAVIAEFEKQRNNAPIENIINDTIKNKDLADAYSSLAIYVKNRHQYIANMLALHMTESDPYRFSGWVMAVATVKPEEWPKIDQFYATTNHKKLSDAIGDCSDLRFAVYHELLGMIVDPKYKPALILENVPNHQNSPSAPQTQGQPQGQHP